MEDGVDARKFGCESRASERIWSSPFDISTTTITTGTIISTTEKERMEEGVEEDEDRRVDGTGKRDIDGSISGGGDDDDGNGGLWSLAKAPG
ncbi:hypothetical protein M0804_005100 [Polistes exclamans]|nr:hypothetical protein M0804_005100 [Polistes exclamans]